MQEVEWEGVGTGSSLDWSFLQTMCYVQKTVDFSLMTPLIEGRMCECSDVFRVNPSLCEVLVFYSQDLNVWMYITLCLGDICHMSYADSISPDQPAHLCGLICDLHCPLIKVIETLLY